MKIQEKGVLLLYFRKMIPEQEVNSLEAILSYRHDMSELFLPSGFKEIIEIPIYENDSFCEIKANIILEKDELVVKEKFIFEEMDLKTNCSQTYALVFSDENSKFYLVFDAFFKSSLTMSSENITGKRNILKIKIQELLHLKDFFKKREYVNREKYMLKKNISDHKYFLEMSFFQQKYALELSFDEISTLNLREFFFIFQENEQDLSTMMKFQVKKYFY